MVSIPLVHAVCRRLCREQDRARFEQLVKALRLILDEATEANFVEFVVRHQLNLLADLPPDLRSDPGRKAA